MHEVVEHEVRGAEAVLHCFHAQGHSQVALADTGRPEKQDVILLADEGAGSKRFELAAVDARLKGPVKSLERAARREPGELERRGDAPLRLPFDLALEHELEKAERRESVTRAFLHQLGQQIGCMRQTQGRALLHQLIEIDFRCTRHRAASTILT